ncbi:MAG: LamG domain-containing protein [Planctomycetota bacterium]
MLSLDGDGDYVNCGNEDIGHIDTAVTVAAWIKTDSLASGDRAVGKSYAWWLGGGSNGTCRFSISNTKPAASTDGSTNVNDGTWHHLAGTYDGATYNLYVDGKLDGSMDATGPINTWDGYWFCIGAHFKKDTAGDPRYFFDGLIDDVRVYDVALSEAEIRLISGLAPKASEPSPADGQTDVGPDVVLGWKSGSNADKHDVYFGSSLEDVKQATTTSDPSNVYKGRQDLTKYPVSVTLDLDKTYYWRIDEVSGPPDFTIHEGRVWSFTTELFAYPIENITGTASSVHQADMGPENTINGSGLDDNDLHSTEETDMWLSSTEPLGAWVEYQFDKAYKLHELLVWNSNRMIESLVGLGFRDVTIECSTNGTDYTTLGTTHEFAQAPGAVGYAHNTTIDLGGAAGKYVRLTANNNWGGIMPQYGLSEVRFIYIPASAREPYPENGATGVEPDVVLDWTAGRGAATHDVYVSTDQQAVIDGTAPVVTVAETSYGPLALDLGVTYYWKINEVNEAQTPTTWESNLWSFTTTDHLVVDDFESYNDLETSEPESNRIYLTWLDGYDVPTNGSLVGYGVPPFAERTIVHSGKQSMPLSYDNTGTAAYSEAERTFAAAQNWTQAGAATLVLYFHGTEGNTGQLYVKVNGTKVVYGGDAADIAKPQWQQWNIDLLALGVDLQNVTKLAIGIDGTGASGTLYFDDIRQYRLAP